MASTTTTTTTTTTEEPKQVKKETLDEPKQINTDSKKETPAAGTSETKTELGSPLAKSEDEGSLTLPPSGPLAVVVAPPQLQVAVEAPKLSYYYVHWQYLTKDVMKSCITFGPVLNMPGVFPVAPIIFDYQKYNDEFSSKNGWPHVIPQYGVRLLTNTPWLLSPFGYAPYYHKDVLQSNIRVTLGDYPVHEDGIKYEQHLKEMDDAMTDLITLEISKWGYLKEGTPITKEYVKMKHDSMILLPKKKGFHPYQKFKVETQRENKRLNLRADGNITVGFKVFGVDDKPVKVEDFKGGLAVKIAYMMKQVAMGGSLTVTTVARMAMIDELENVRQSIGGGVLASLL